MQYRENALLTKHSDFQCLFFHCQYCGCFHKLQSKLKFILVVDGSVPPTSEPSKKTRVESNQSWSRNCVSNWPKSSWEPSKSKNKRVLVVDSDNTHMFDSGQKTGCLRKAGAAYECMGSDADEWKVEWRPLHCFGSRLKKELDSYLASELRKELCETRQTGWHVNHSLTNWINKKR